MTPPKAPSHSRQSSYANSEVARSLLHQRESDNDNDDDLDEVEGKPDVENGRMRQMKGDRDIEDVLDEIGFGMNLDSTATAAAEGREVDGIMTMYRPVSAQTTCEQSEVQRLHRFLTSIHF